MCFSKRDQKSKKAVSEQIPRHKLRLINNKAAPPLFAKASNRPTALLAPWHTS